MTTPTKTEALLLIAPGCAHCPSVMANLSTLIKEGNLARLEIVNIQQYPDIASSYNVRSVPWLKLGDYVLAGSYSLDELRHWAQLAHSEEGLQQYIEQQLADGKLDSMLQQVKQYPHWLKSIINLLKSDDTAIQVRLAIDSIMESMTGSEALHSQVDELGQLAQTIHPSRLADIIYYLGLTNNDKAIPYIENYLHHENPDVVEACNEAIIEIKGP